MLVCHLAMVTGMGPDTSPADGVASQQQQVSLRRGQAQKPMDQGDGKRGRTGKEHARHQGG
eukprot:5532401-Karenia_brevis.AAC.1